MNEDILIDAIGKHLDLLEKITIWASLLSLAIGWAGIQRSEDIEAMGMRFKRKQAFAAVAGVYFVVNFIVIILFLRIGDLLYLIADPDKIARAITTMASHTLIVNPFAYFGPTAIFHSYGGEGLGLLVVIWWVCLTSLKTLTDGKELTLEEYIFVGVFLILGLAAVWAVFRVYAIVIEKGARLPPELLSAIKSTGDQRIAEAIGGAALGALIFIMVRIYTYNHSDRVPAA